MQELVISVEGSKFPFAEDHSTMPGFSVKVVEEFQASRSVEFKPGENWSNDLTVLNMHTVPFRYYFCRVEYLDIDHGLSKDGEYQITGKMKVAFAMTYINSFYTFFEMKWKYVEKEKTRATIEASGKTKTRSEAKTK